ncbi:MAG: ABC transporter substrate-binding protein [Spirochaetaceae bacterium]|jgi:putative aldouronate transport system substrate-binding protein|nr:ABC transporter substrate-binding protein [Spirochaetaceae bacterium]
MMKKAILVLPILLLLCLPLFAGGSGDQTKASGNAPIELVYYVGGRGAQVDLPAVLVEVNKYLTDKIGCTLKIIETDFGNYNQKLQMVIASQEEFDLCYTADWSGDFYNNVSKNAFLELDDLIDQYAPQLKTDIPANGWEAVKVNGKIMAVPNQQIWARSNGWAAQVSYLEKYNFNPTTVKKVADLEPLLAAIKRDNPTWYPLSAHTDGILDFLTYYMGYDELIGRHIPGVILFTDNNLKAINQFELPQVQEHYRLMRQWNQKGYIRPDAATVTDISADSKAGRLPVGFPGTMKPGQDVQDTISNGGRPIKSFALSTPIQTTSGITGTMTAISRTSKHPDKAIQFINLMNSDKYLYNLIINGIEGKHYTWIDKDFIRPIPNSGYTPNADWMYGNQFLAYFKEGQSVTDWEETIKINTSAKPSPALGFVFNPIPVQTEIAGVSAVVKEYELALDTGAVDPDRVLPEFLAKLKGAGSDILLTELQKQLDAWKQSK